MTKLIVIIEDDSDILDLMKLILEDEGYTVEGYTDLDGIDKVIEKRPLMVLLDLRLPNDYGNTFCFSIKSNPATMHIPVVLVSATYRLAEIAAKCKADAYLAKPYDVDDLVGIVKGIVGSVKPTI